MASSALRPPPNRARSRRDRSSEIGSPCGLAIFPPEPIRFFIESLSSGWFVVVPRVDFSTSFREHPVCAKGRNEASRRQLLEWR